MCSICSKFDGLNQRSAIAPKSSKRACKCRFLAAFRFDLHNYQANAMIAFCTGGDPSSMMVTLHLA